MPAPRTLGELRARYLVDSLPPCLLPRAQNDVLLEMPAPDSGLRLRLPAGWALRPTSDTVQAIFDGPATSRIIAFRIRSGAIGIHWLTTDESGTPAHGVQCQVAQDSIGSIWTLYDAGAALDVGDPGRVPSKPSALGNVITRAGLRYHVTITANSEQQRDEVAAAVAASVLRVSQTGF